MTKWLQFKDRDFSGRCSQQHVAGGELHLHLQAFGGMDLRKRVGLGQGAENLLSIDTLKQAVWLVREEGSGTREASDSAVLPHLGGYQRSIELGSSEAIRNAAALGLGIACLSRFVIEDFVGDGRLCLLQSQMPRTDRQCYWVVHRDKHFTPALKAFVNLLKEVQ